MGSQKGSFSKRSFSSTVARVPALAQPNRQDSRRAAGDSRTDTVRIGSSFEVVAAAAATMVSRLSWWLCRVKG